MATLMTMNVKERRERIPVVEKQGDLIKHRDLWKQSDLVDSPEIKLGNSIDPNQIHEALHPQTVQKVEAKEGNTNDNQNQAKTKVITFEPPTTLFVFEKVTEFPQPIVKSTLTQAVGASKIVSLPVLFTAANLPDTYDETDTLPSSSKKDNNKTNKGTVFQQTSLNIDIPETATFLHLIKTVIKHHNKTNPNNIIKDIPEAYIITFENQPQYVYSPKHIIAKFVSQVTFIISEDPKYQKSRQTGKKNYRQLKIKLPTGQGAKTNQTISIEATAKSQQILTEVCSKAKLDPTEYILTWNGKPLNRDLTVEDIWNEGGQQALEVVERESPNLNDTASTDIFWYKKLAQKYTRYNCIYYNKKGIKNKMQEVVLGIDGEHITQSVIRKKGAQKQSEPRHIKEVLNCGVVVEGSPKFFIEFSDRSIHFYDCHADVDVAKEIVGKINFLMKEK